MTDIFISYSRSDRGRIEKLAAALEAEGLDVWWDKNLTTGAHFTSETEARVKEAKAVIVAWSEASIKSMWVADEATIGRDKGVLMPLAIDLVEAPIGFRQIQTMAFDKWRGDGAAAEFQELLQAIKARLGVEPSAPVASLDDTKLSPAARLKTLGISAAIAVAVLSAGWFGLKTLQKPGAPLSGGSSEVIAAKILGEYKSIAVLSFVDLSPDRDQEYFSDGVAEELLNVLARETDLRVAARTSSFAFKDKNETVAKIGEVLNVDAVLEGSVRKAGEKVRITAQLIDARSGFHLWSETYDRELRDVFAVQDEIAGAIVRSLPSEKPRLDPAAVKQANSEAYDLYLQGRHQLGRRTRASIEAGKTLFEQALEIDPDYAPAWAELAMSTLLLMAGQSTYGDMTLAEVTAIAAPAIENALALDPALAEAYAARGLLFASQFDVAGSAAAYKKALDLNPNVANVRHLLYLTLFRQGAFGEAFEVIDRAVALDPLSAIALENHVSSLVERGRFEDALASAKRLNDLHPDWYHAKTALARAYAANGQFAQTAYWIQVASEASGGDNLDVEAAFNMLNIKAFDHPSLASAPVDPLSFVAVVTGNDDEARALALENYKAKPQNPFALWRAVWTLWATGEDSAALSLVEDFATEQGKDDRAWAVRPTDCYPGLYVAGLRQRNGAKPEDVQPIIAACREILENISAQGRVLPFYERDMEAELMVLEGRYDEALAELRRLTDSGLFISWWIVVEPIYEPLRDDPRFQAIVADLDAFAEREREEYLEIVAGNAGLREE